MRHIWLMIIMVVLTAATAQAQDAWYETAETCSVSYAVSNVTREIAAGDSTQLNSLALTSEVAQEVMVEADRIYKTDCDSARFRELADVDKWGGVPAGAAGAKMEPDQQGNGDNDGPLPTGPPGESGRGIH